jgi:hypothetical protein
MFFLQARKDPIKTKIPERPFDGMGHNTCIVKQA